MGTRVRLYVSVGMGALVFVLIAVGLPVDGLPVGLALGAMTGGLAFVRLAPKPPVVNVRIVHENRGRRSTSLMPKSPPGWRRPRKRGR